MQSINSINQHGQEIKTYKNLNQKLKHKISKSVTLTSRSLRVGHDGTASNFRPIYSNMQSINSSINMVKRYRLTKTLTKNLKHKISKSVTLTSRSPRVGHDGTA